MASRVWTNVSTVYRIVGNGFLPPNQSLTLDDSQIAADDIAEMDAGYLTADPVLDDAARSVILGGDESPAEVHADIIRQFMAANKAVVLPDDDITPGINVPANDTSIDQYCAVVDGNGVINSFDNATTVTLEVIADTTGGATITDGSGSGASSAPGALDGAIKEVTVVNGKILFTLVRGGSVGAVTVGVVDTAGNGLDASSTLEFTFTVSP